ncbi:hypothetical protein HZY91_10660 [Facklamia sp. DSM 111018]|uniref:Uncharacterized protein n=1 Tax=Facklamia lactis TaxID=2749967 RepID=A0ABS0LTB4_9LACT|nr:hypothetical protein [Facklamia lactis]MBG9979462.1 hypothetical protein [Facklamia lactis]MBG9987327.1 hypothetical protein [Facklamia lactis]
MVSTNQFPPVANQTLRDLLEWPMEINEGNRERFAHLGSKGGSTGFILNDALYAENHQGDRIEMVLLTDDLSLGKQMFLSHHLNSFESKLLGSEDFRREVKEALSDS